MKNSKMITFGELSKIFSLLSSLFLCRPSKNALENWRILLVGGVPDFMLDLRDALDEVDLQSEQELQDLLWEYTRLFIGPYKLPCPPWESVYTSPQRLMKQEACDEVESLYGEIGLTINNAGVMPDHVGVELNFLGILWEKINNDPQKRSDFMVIAKRFWDEHLQRWIPQFTRDMEMATKFPIYKSLARVTRDFIINRLNPLNFPSRS